MNETTIKNLLNLLTILSAEVKELKQWKAEQDNRIKADEEEQRFAQAEFEKFIAERRAAESKRAADEAKLREKMV